MEYQKCSGSWSCLIPKATSVTEKAHKATELLPSWRPFSHEESPCNCGCTYIVNGQRSVEITSASHCATLPLTWTIKASGKLLVDFQLVSSDFSCGHSLLNVRKTEDEEEIIPSTKTKNSREVEVKEETSKGGLFQFLQANILSDTSS